MKTAGTGGRMRTKKRRNRRKRVHGYAHRVPVAVFVVMAMVLLIGTLWVKASCDAIGAEIQRLEQYSQELSERLLTEEMKWNRLRSVDQIRRSLANYGIRMDWPERDQVVMLPGVDASRMVRSVREMPGDDRYAGVGRTGRYE